MNKPIMKLKVEIWDSANEYLKHAPWYMWAAWFITNRPFYRQMQALASSKTFYARGIYDCFHDKIILCMNDIAYSVVSSLQGSTAGKYHMTFALQTYFTLVHEMLHKAKVAKDESNGGHKIDFDAFEKLSPALQDMFDGLLEMEGSNDAFTNHPENKRNPNG